MDGQGEEEDISLYLFILFYLYNMWALSAAQTNSYKKRKKLEKLLRSHLCSSYITFWNTHHPYWKAQFEPWLFCFASSFLLIRTLGGSKWWLKYGSPCPPDGRPRWSDRVLASAWPSSGSCISELNQWREDLSVFLSLSLSNRMNVNKATKRKTVTNETIMLNQSIPSIGVTSCNRSSEPSHFH